MGKGSMKQNGEHEIGGKARQKGKENGCCPTMAGNKTADQDEEKDGRADETQAFQEEGVEEDKEKGQVNSLFVRARQPELDRSLTQFPCLNQDEDGEYSKGQAGHQGTEPCTRRGKGSHVELRRPHADRESNSQEKKTG